VIPTYDKNFRKFTLTIETLQALQCEKMKFRNAWPRRYWILYQMKARGKWDFLILNCKGYDNFLVSNLRSSMLFWDRKLMRQWFKNGFQYSLLIFSHGLIELVELYKTVYGQNHAKQDIFRVFWNSEQNCESAIEWQPVVSSSWNRCSLIVCVVLNRRKISCSKGAVTSWKTTYFYGEKRSSFLFKSKA
jgi:hypothetical protein